MRKSFFMILILCFIIMACAQDAIFYNISTEPEPAEPIIKGTPTDIVLLDNKIYVGTYVGQDIYIYDRGVWSSMQAGGRIYGLAAGTNDLYVLVSLGDPFESTEVRSFNADTGEWTDFSVDASASGYRIESIKCTKNGKLFASSKSPSNEGPPYALLYCDVSSKTIYHAANFLLDSSSTNSVLSGAAEDTSGDVYLSTGTGVYRIDAASTTPALIKADFYAGAITGTAGTVMAGIIETGGQIVAVGNDNDANGYVFIYDDPTNPSAGFEKSYFPYTFTGAMNVWNRYDSSGSPKPAALLLGVKSRVSSDVVGYRELDLSDEGKASFTMRTFNNSNPPLSARDYATFRSSIGRYPILSIFQVPESLGGYTQEDFDNPDWRPLVFASTVNEGLWSCRGGLWNAEE